MHSLFFSHFSLYLQGKPGVDGPRGTEGGLGRTVSLPEGATSVY